MRDRRRADRPSHARARLAAFTGAERPAVIAYLEYSAANAARADTPVILAALDVVR